MEPSRMVALAGVACELNRALKEKSVSVKIVDGYVWLIAHDGEFVRLYTDDDRFEIADV